MVFIRATHPHVRNMGWDLLHLMPESVGTPRGLPAKKLEGNESSFHRGLKPRKWLSPSSPSPPCSPTRSWSPRRILSGLLQPLSQDYEPGDRCLSHRARDCAHCVKITNPLAAQRQAMTELRHRFKQTHRLSKDDDSPRRYSFSRSWTPRMMLSDLTQPLSDRCLRHGAPLRRCARCEKVTEWRATIVLRRRF